MRLKLVLLLCFAALPAFGQSTAKTFTLNAANQCATIGVSGLSTVGIQVTGTFSATLQPEVAIAGQSPQNTQVTPSTSSTAQATITATGVYKAAVGGFDEFLVCVSSYSSGTATVWLNPSGAVNASLFGSGGGGSSTPPQTLPAGITTSKVFGDSLSQPFGPMLGQMWGALLSGVGSWNMTDLAQSGSGIITDGPFGSSQMTEAYAQTPVATNISLALLGANDNYSSAADITSLERSYMAFTVWLGLPASQKTVVAGGNCTGSWSSISEFGVNSEYSTTAGNTCTMTATGTTVYVAGWCGNTGQNILQESISIDGGTAQNFTLQAPNVIQSYALRFSGLSSGSHTIVLTVLTGGVRGILSWVGGNGAGTGLPPVAIGATIPQTGVTSGGARNTATQAMLAQLQADGLSVYWVDDSAVLSLTAVPAQYQGDGIHMTSLGDALLGAFWVSQFFSQNLATEAAFGTASNYWNYPATRSVYANPNPPVTVAANTTGDQNLAAWTIPLGIIDNLNNITPSQNRAFRVFAAGVYSTPIASTATLEFKIKLCSVAGCGSGTVVPLLDIITTANAGTITNDPWNLSAYISCTSGGSAATYETHGTLNIDLGATTATAATSFLDTNAAASSPTINAVAPLFLQVTVAFSAGSTSNSVTQRQENVEMLAFSI